MNYLYEYSPGILLVYAAFALGLVTPGPNILAVIGTSMSVSRKAGVAVAAGVAGGTFVWATLTVLGLAALFSTFASALVVLRLLGGAYLIWLAYLVFRAAASNDEFKLTRQTENSVSARQYIMRGILIQLSNPKAALAWFAILPLCIDANAPAWVWITVIAGTTVMSVIGHFTYAILFSTDRAVATFRKSRRTGQFLLGAFFAILGFKLLVTGS